MVKGKTIDQIIIRKVSGVVILYNNDYLTKLFAVVNDKSKFKELNQVKDFDWTVKMEKKICKILKVLVNNKEIFQKKDLIH